MPNTGDTSESSLLGMVEGNATAGLHTTFIGIGVDFNTTLIDAITKVRGANYYSVHNEAEFKTRMDDEFEYMVTPLVFDLQLEFSSEGYAIDVEYWPTPDPTLTDGAREQILDAYREVRDHLFAKIKQRFPLAAAPSV